MRRRREETRHVEVLAWLMSVVLSAVLTAPAMAAATTSSLTLAGKLSRTDSLVSANGVFAFGFFPSSSARGVFGLGIWYEQLVSIGTRTVVWVAERDLKLGKHAYLEFVANGTLAVFDPGRGGSQPVWTSDNSPMQASSLNLRNDGNLVLQSATNATPVWQSFDTPTDTLLPGQTLSASQNRALISWCDDGDWSAGYYLCSWLPTNGTSTLALSWNGNSIKSWNASSWSNYSVSINPTTTYYPYLNDTLFSTYIGFDGNFYAGNASGKQVVLNSTSRTVGPLRRATLDRDGGFRLYSWILGTSIEWSVENNWLSQPCSVFAECGPFAVCSPNPDSPAFLGLCTCPENFSLVDEGDPTNGCKRNLQLPSHYVNTTKIVMQKVGDTDYPFANRMFPYVNCSEAECLALCKQEWECEGAIFWRRDGRCYIKSGPLFNGGFPQDVGGHSAYLKVLAAPLSSDRSRKRVVKFLTLGLVASVVGLGVLISVWWWRRRRRRSRMRFCEPLFADFGPRKYSLRELSAATKNFSELIGRGGMGCVYRGVVRPVGEVVAVKRIRHESCGGQEGFLAEASSISQIRHRNLMQLKGWCMEDGKLMLVYDYMPNGSLDQWLYNNKNNNNNSEFNNRTGKTTLAWSSRFSILTGVAAALAYLHEDWQQCVLHRDIKSGNVLLDADFNAQLGDFGLARLIDHAKMEKTTAMAGTLGYMAPEMPFTGKATKETDTYSFGVLMLEVVCGKKPVDCYDDEVQDVVLLHRVWRAHEAGNLLAVVDPRLRIEPRKDAPAGKDWPSSRWELNANHGDENFDIVGSLSRRVAEEMEREGHEQTRVLKLGLLCCLPNPCARPSMRLVHQILTGDVDSMPNLPNSNQFSQLDAMAAIQHNFHPKP